MVRKRTGVNPLAERWEDDLRGYIARMLVVSEALVLLNVVLVAVGPPIYDHLVPIAALEHRVVQTLGGALLVVALAWVVTAQIQMGDSWRIGVDPEAKTELVTAGLFLRSRNPVFLGMRVSLLGIFLAAPNALALIAAVLGEVLIQVQVRIEEPYLDGVHGESYRDYRRRVRRWL